MKANKDMTENEFLFSSALRRAYNTLYEVEDEIKRAKVAAPQGLSVGTLRIVESDVYVLKASLIKALKTVGEII